MVHGDLKGVILPQTLVITTPPNALTIQANILIDQNFRACLADFGLLTIVLDCTRPTTSNSLTNAGTVKWMSPELLDPDKFGLKNSRRTKESDFYALGMVILEVLSGRSPFSGYVDLVVTKKVIEGERPGRPQGAEEVWFTDDLWGMLERCWSPHPKDRPDLEAVLECLERVSTVWQPLPAGEDDDDQSDSDNESLLTVSYVLIFLYFISNLTCTREENATGDFTPDFTSDPTPDPRSSVVSSTTGAFERQSPGTIATESMYTSGTSSPPRAVSPQPSVKPPFVVHGKNKRARIDDSGSASGSRPKNRRITLTADVGEILAKYLELLARTYKPGELGAQPESSPRQGPPTSLMASANVRNDPANQQRTKRDRTSSGDEEGSPPKRPRLSPSGGDHLNPPDTPRNQPPMTSIGGPPRPQNMQNGMIRPPVNMAYQTIF